MGESAAADGTHFETFKTAMNPTSAPDSGTGKMTRTCPFCEAHCAVEIEFDRAAGSVLKVRGDKTDPFSQGFICPKAYALRGLREDPDILRMPLVKRGRDFEEISWQAAFDLAAERLGDIRQRFGRNAVGIYLGNAFSHHLGQALYVTPLLVELGTLNVFTSSSVDVMPKVLATGLMFGSQASFLVPDIDRTDFMLIIGGNPVVSNGSLMTAPDMPRRLKAIRERGGRVVVVDPRRTETAQLADQYLAIRPATDAFLLFAMVHTIFEEGLIRLRHMEGRVRDLDRLQALARQFLPEAVTEHTGVDAVIIRDLTRRLAASPSAVVYGRVGANVQVFGSLTAWLIDALNVLTGNVDRPGGMMVPNSIVPSQLFHDRYQGDKPPYANWFSRVKGMPAVAGQLPAVTLADEIETEGEGQIRGFITVGANPARSNPNSRRLVTAFDRLDFMLSIDRYVNETTRHAHLIIPTPDVCEMPDFPVIFSPFMVRSYAKWSSPLFAPTPGMPRDYEVFLEITARLAGKTTAEVEEGFVRIMLQQQLGRDPALAGVDVEKARAALGNTPGPARICDLLVRSGVHGDGFGVRPGGLTLAAIQAMPGGVVDKGPIEVAGLDALLHTPDKKVHLAPDILAADVPRLTTELHKPRNKESMLLIGRRQLRSNLSWMHNVHALVKGSDRCTLLVNPDDANRLGLRTGMKARVCSRVGQVDAPVEVSDEMMAGVVCLPFGWGHDEPGTRLSIASKRPGVNFNALADEALIDLPSCNSAQNGIPVSVEPSAV